MEWCDQPESATLAVVVGKNQLLSARTRARATPEVSFKAMSETLKAGIELGRASWENRTLRPEERSKRAKWRSPAPRAC